MGRGGEEGHALEQIARDQKGNENRTHRRRIETARHHHDQDHEHLVLRLVVELVCVWYGLSQCTTRTKEAKTGTQAPKRLMGCLLVFLLLLYEPLAQHSHCLTYNNKLYCHPPIDKTLPSPPL